MQLVLVIVGAIVVTAFAQRRELQPALVITLVALAVSLIPGLPRLELESEVILGVVLPPLLYTATLEFSLFAFFRKLGPILVLGESLVNDAAALTLFAVAVASVSGRDTFIENPVLLFLYAAEDHLRRQLQPRQTGDQRHGERDQRDHQRRLQLAALRERGDDDRAHDDEGPAAPAAA